MIDTTTGMRTGERYRVENIERAHQFPGFFLDGKYFLGPELLTAVGWLEGTRFIYDNLDAAGEPVFPERIAGEIHDLTLTLVDGTTLQLRHVDASAEAVDAEASVSTEQGERDGPAPAPRPGQTMRAEHSVGSCLRAAAARVPAVVGLAVIGLIAGALFCRRKHR